MTDKMKQLVRRTVEIDYTHKHRHLGGSLSALPIIDEVFDGMIDGDVFILSKGHAAPAYYAVLEAKGFEPDTSHPHPYRDPQNGIPVTTGSLGHGLPLAVGFAFAEKMRGSKSRVTVLLGDGEALEGTTWESLNIAAALGLEHHLRVIIDQNGWQGSCPTVCNAGLIRLRDIFPVRIIKTRRGEGVRLFEENQDWHTHLISDEEFAQIMEELK